MRTSVKKRVGELEGRSDPGNIKLARSLSHHLSVIYGEEGEEEPEIRTEGDAQAFLLGLRGEIERVYAE
jgi:hypothetical protein